LNISSQSSVVCFSATGKDWSIGCV
jgi:hypothetical protein